MIHPKEAETIVEKLLKDTGYVNPHWPDRRSDFVDEDEWTISRKKLTESLNQVLNEIELRGYIKGYDEAERDAQENS